MILILIWTPRCLNAWKMPPFICQNLKLLIWWIIVEWVATSWLWWKSLSSCLNKTSLLTSELDPYEIMKVLGNSLSFLGKKKIRSFGLLELKIWDEHWTVSGLQDSFRFLRCCYNLDLKTAFLDLNVHMKVVGLCLTKSV